MGIPDAGLKMHAGWLTKKGEGIMAKSQQRWFALYRNGECHYFDNDQPSLKSHKGLIVLRGVPFSAIQRVKPGTNDYSFTITTPKRKWHLRATSKPDWDGWYFAFEDLLKGS